MQNRAYFRAGQPYKCQVAIVRVWSVAPNFSLRITRCDIWFQTGFHKLMCDVTLAVSVFYIWSVVVCKHFLLCFMFWSTCWSVEKDTVMYVSYPRNKIFIFTYCMEICFFIYREPSGNKSVWIYTIILFCFSQRKLISLGHLRAFQVSCTISGLKCNQEVFQEPAEGWS